LLPRGLSVAVFVLLIEHSRAQFAKGIGSGVCFPSNPRHGQMFVI
jgi:hypothetical protein